MLTNRYRNLTENYAKVLSKPPRETRTDQGLCILQDVDENLIHNWELIAKPFPGRSAASVEQTHYHIRSP